MEKSTIFDATDNREEWVKIRTLIELNNFSRRSICKRAAVNPATTWGWDNGRTPGEASLNKVKLALKEMLEERNRKIQEMM